jgi:hypothetical protein
MFGFPYLVNLCVERTNSAAGEFNKSGGCAAALIELACQLQRTLDARSSDTAHSVQCAEKAPWLAIDATRTLPVNYGERGY